MRRLWICTAMLSVMLGSSVVRAAQRDFSGPFDRPGTVGIGLTAAPSLQPLSIFSLGLGPTVKVFFPKGVPLAVQSSGGFGLGFGLLAINLDVLYEAPRLHDDVAYSLNWYVGVGGAIGAYWSPVLADARGNILCAGTCPASMAWDARLIGGIGWQLKRAPVEITFEWRPGVLSVALPVVGPRLWLAALDAAAGFRYFF